MLLKPQPRKHIDEGRTNIGMSPGEGDVGAGVLLHEDGVVGGLAICCMSEAHKPIPGGGDVAVCGTAAAASAAAATPA